MGRIPCRLFSCASYHLHPTERHWRVRRSANYKLAPHQPALVPTVKIGLRYGPPNWGVETHSISGCVTRTPRPYEVGVMLVNE